VFLRPSSWPEALALRAAHPQAVPVLGGTDLMPEVQHGRRALPAVLDLTRVAGIGDVEWEGERLRLGAGLTWARLLAAPPARLPALLQAADEIGTPVLRLRGTVGGHVCAAWANGDALAPLLAAGAEVELRSVRGTRRTSLATLLRGHRECVMEPDELVAAVLVAPQDGHEAYLRVGTRAAMVVATCGVAVRVDPARRRVGVAHTGAAPVPRTVPGAADFLAGALEEAGAWDAPGTLAPAVMREFGARVAAGADPHDDLYGTAGYRRHAVGVLARRALGPHALREAA
jgi:CO/xanthine dehydrogenase FAD-binding subunit